MGSSAEIPVGERLRFYRTGQRKTQAVVAGLAGVSEDYLSQIERGLKSPTITLLHRFARILGVPVFRPGGGIPSSYFAGSRVRPLWLRTCGPLESRASRSRMA